MMPSQALAGRNSGGKSTDASGASSPQGLATSANSLQSDSSFAELFASCAQAANEGNPASPPGLSPPQGPATSANPARSDSSFLELFAASAHLANDGDSAGLPGLSSPQYVAVSADLSGEQFLAATDTTAPQMKANPTNVSAATLPNDGAVRRPRTPAALNPDPLSTLLPPSAIPAWMLPTPLEGGQEVGAGAAVPVLPASSPKNALTIAPPAGPTAPAATAGNLAFALRLSSGTGQNTAAEAAIQNADSQDGNSQSGGPQGDSTQGANTLAGSAALATTFTAHIKAVTDSATTAGSSPRADPATTSTAASIHLIAPSIPTSISGGAASTSPSAATRSSAPVEIPDEVASRGAGPLRSVRVELTGQDNQRIELRLVESGGSLSVSVRSPDGGLTHSLQESLPELNSRLAEQRYQTEVWTPHAASAGADSDSGTPGNNSDKSGTGGQKNGSSGSDQNPDSRSAHSRQQSGERQDWQPAWLRQLLAFDSSL